MADEMELSAAMAAAFLIPLLLSDVAHSSIHPSIESPLPSLLPSAPLIPDISLSLPLTLKAVIDRQMMPPPPLPSARWVLRQK